MTDKDPVLYEFRLSDLIFACRELNEMWFDGEEAKVEKADDFLDWIRDNYNSYGWAFARDVRFALEEVALHNPEFWDPATETMYELISNHLEDEEEEEDEDDE